MLREALAIARIEESMQEYTSMTLSRLVLREVLLLNEEV
jgi:hypothetical protein